MTDAASQFKHPPREHFFPRFNKVLLVLIAVVLGSPLAFRSLPIVKEKAGQDAAIAKADADLAVEQMMKTRLEREVRLLQHDSEYLSIFARDLNPGYMAPGETVFQMPRPAQN